MNKIEPIKKETIDAMKNGLLSASMVAEIAEKINEIISATNGEPR